MTRYCVVSPGYVTLPDTGYAYDVVEVEAETPRAAKVEAIRKWRGEQGLKLNWLNWFRDERTTPFKGLRVYPVNLPTEWKKEEIKQLYSGEIC